MSWYCSLLAGLSPSLSLSLAACCIHSSAEEVPSVALLRPDSPTDSVRGIALMPSSARSACPAPSCFLCSCCARRRLSGKAMNVYTAHDPLLVVFGPDIRRKSRATAGMCEQK